MWTGSLLIFVCLWFQAFPVAGAPTSLQSPKAGTRIVTIDKSGKRVPFIQLFFQATDENGELAEPMRFVKVMTDADGQADLPVGTLPPGQGGKAGPECGAAPTRDLNWQADFVGDDENGLYMCWTNLSVRTWWESRDGSDTLWVEADGSPPGAMSIILCRPDGRPLPETPVELYVHDENLSPIPGAVLRLRGRADTDGRIRVSLSPAQVECAIVVPGHGFGGSGVVDITSSKTTERTLPPLHAFGTVRGRIDPKLGPGPWNVAHGLFGAPRVKVVSDNNGMFVLADIRPGAVALDVTRVGAEAEEPSRLIWTSVLPEQERDLGVVAPRAKEKWELPIRGEVPDAQEPRLNGGVVVDASGKPIAGADVYWVGETSSFCGLSCMLSTILRSKSGQDGKFKFQDPGVASDVWLFAQAAGRPLAVANSLRQPLVIPDGGSDGSLRVRVLHQGQPLGNARVALEPKGRSETYPTRGWNDENNADLVKVLRKQFKPDQMTNPDGWATFEGLRPGEYTVLAEFGAGAQSSPAQAPQGAKMRQKPKLSGLSFGVAVVTGECRTHVMAVYPRRSDIAFQIRNPDGTSALSRRPKLEFSAASPEASSYYHRWRYRSSQSGSLNEQGHLQGAELTPGLWQVKASFYDSDNCFYAVVEQTVDIVLPATIHLTGRVTVDGKPEPNRAFRVMAAYSGMGKLDEFRHVETTAQPDGSFELRGLSPGRVRIQAVMDDIWLSKSVELTIGDVAPAPLVLDIAPPGRPKRIRIVDLSGKPMIDAKVLLARPAGPYAQRLWPASLRTDGEGVLHLEGFEEGEHELRLETTGVVRQFKVGARNGGKPSETSETLAF